MKKAGIHQMLLFITGFIFLFIAVATLINPQKVAENYALILLDTDSLNQFRAVYFGFFTGLFVLFSSAAWFICDVRLGNLCAILILCQSVGRFLSFMLDGMPQPAFIGAALGEFILAILILNIKPEGGCSVM